MAESHADGGRSSQREEAVSLERAMQQGAFGFAHRADLPAGVVHQHRRAHRAAPSVASRHGGVYISHVRGEASARKEAIGEAIRDRTKRRRLPVVIYHLKIGAKANWGHMDDIQEPRSRTRGRKA